MQLGFIGLGVMGKPMSRNLLRAGHHVTVHNRSRPAVDELSGQGAVAADTAVEVVAACDIVFTCLPGPAEVEEVLLADSFLDALSPGMVIVDTSTITPELSKRVHEAASERGAQALDAPVSGGEPGAINGALSIMVGGPAEAFDRVEPLFKAMGETIVRVGGPGAGQTVKAANQVLVAGAIQLVGEAFAILGSGEVDKPAAIEVLCGGLGGNEILRRKGLQILAEEFDPGFRIDLHVKDLEIALGIGKDHQLPMPVAALILQFLISVQAHGGGGLDHSALTTVVQRLAATSNES